MNRRHPETDSVVSDMDSLTLACLVLIVIVFGATPAYAYIDPGSGSMLVQLVTGGVAGAAVLARLYWKRLKDKVTGKSAPPEPARDSSNSPPQTGA